MVEKRRAAGQLGGVIGKDLEMVMENETTSLESGMNLLGKILDRVREELWENTEYREEREEVERRLAEDPDYLLNALTHVDLMYKARAMTRSLISQRHTSIDRQSYLTPELRSLLPEYAIPGPIGKEEPIRASPPQIVEFSGAPRRSLTPPGSRRLSGRLTTSSSVSTWPRERSRSRSRDRRRSRSRSPNRRRRRSRSPDGQRSRSRSLHRGSCRSRSLDRRRSRSRSPDGQRSPSRSRDRKRRRHSSSPESPRRRKSTKSAEKKHKKRQKRKRPSHRHRSRSHSRSRSKRSESREERRRARKERKREKRERRKRRRSSSESESSV